MSMPTVGHVIGSKWTALSLLYDYPECRSFLVKNNETGERAICDVEVLNAEEPELGNAAKVIKELTLCCSTCVATFIAYGVDSVRRYHYLCTAPFCSFDYLRNALPHAAKRAFSLFTALYIGRETLSAIKEFHDAGYVHRSIGPRAIGIGCRHGMEDVFLLISTIKRWLSPDGTPLPLSSSCSTRCCGFEYASINAMRRREQSRLDDLWSWFYVIVSLTTGSLPWSDLVINQELEVNAVLNLFAKVKQTVHDEPSRLLQSTPEEYKKIFRYLSTLPPERSPDYGLLHGWISDAMSRARNDSGGEMKLDWEPGGRYYEQLQPLMEQRQ